MSVILTGLLEDRILELREDIIGITREIELTKTLICIGRSETVEMTTESGIDVTEQMLREIMEELECKRDEFIQLKGDLVSQLNYIVDCEERIS